MFVFLMIERETLRVDMPAAPGESRYQLCPLAVPTKSIKEGGEVGEEAGGTAARKGYSPSIYEKYVWNVGTYRKRR